VRRNWLPEIIREKKERERESEREAARFLARTFSDESESPISRSRDLIASVKIAKS